MSFRPDIKPPQWGPLSAVQYAVRANAERLEIDPLKILVLFPGWGDTNPPIDLASGLFATPLSGFSPGSRNYVFASDVQGSGATIPNARITANIGAPFTVIAQVRNVSTQTYGKTLCVGINARSDQHMSIDANNGFFRAAVGAGSPNMSLSGRNLQNSNQYALVKPSGSTGNIYFNAGAGGTSGSLYASNGAPFTLGPQATGYGGHETELLAYFGQNLLVGGLLGFFKETPYALLMPVSRPVYFDMGAGGGYTYQFTSAPTTTTSVSNVVASVLKELSTEAATTTSTNTTIVNLLKDLIVAASSVTNTSQPVYNINRDFYIESNSTVNTNNIALLISGFIELIVSSVTNTNTSGVTINTLKELLSSATVTTTTNNIAVFIETLIELIASSAIQTNTSSTFLATKRELSVSSISAAQVQNVVINVIREFISLAQSGASTSEIQVFISSLLEFIVNSTINTETTDVAINIVKELTTDVVSGVSLSVALATVDRKISATTNSQSTTAAMHLVLSGIAAITDTLIFSKTINRNIYSKTVNRIITQV